MQKLLSIGDNVKPGSYRLHSCFKKVANFVCGDDFVSLTDPSICLGPNNIQIQDLDLYNIDSLEVSKDSVKIKDLVFNFAKEERYHSQFEINLEKLQNFKKNVGFLKQYLVQKADKASLVFVFDEKRLLNFKIGFAQNMAKQLKDGIKSLFNTNLEHGIYKIKGLGFGLTPSGDDFIAGLLLALNIIEKNKDVDLSNLKESIFSIAKKDEALSSSFLKLAQEGKVIDVHKKLILSLYGQDKQELKASIDACMDIGNTSGSDILTGLVYTIDNKDKLSCDKDLFALRIEN
ncbi:MAG: DUF2877 domain-containing protein [Pseudomonadota bacterium]